jgi:hypothetical protein
MPILGGNKLEQRVCNEKDCRVEMERRKKKRSRMRLKNI